MNRAMARNATQCSVLRLSRRRGKVAPTRMAVTPRREFLRRLGLGTTIVLVGNLGGVTSSALSLVPSLARAGRLDVLYPVNGYKRQVDFANEYEVLVPRDWLADQTIARKRATQREELTGLTLPRPNERMAPLPVAAFGPAKTSGEENLSVVLTEGLQSNPLDQFDDPGKAAEELLKAIVPEGSGLSAELEGAKYRGEGKAKMLDMEYSVAGQRFARRNRSVVAVRGDRVYTFNFQVPEQLWSRDGQLAETCAQSFRLL